MLRMIGFEFEHDANFGARESTANSRKDGPCGGARRAESGGNHADRGVKDAPGERSPRGVRSGHSSLWRKPRPGMGRKTRGNRRIAGDMAPHRTSAKQ